MFFDSHAHYNDEAFGEDRDALLASLPLSGIDYIVNIGDTLKASADSIAIAEKYPFAYAAVGIHPQSAGELDDAALGTLERMAAHEKVVAIGEIGLDYYYENESRALQKDAFIRQLMLADKVGLPVVIHDRDAHGDTMDILKTHLKSGGVMHCFSGSVELAREVLRLGMYIALGGVVTYKNAVKTVEVAKMVPPDRLLLETDCPYLSPVPCRGKRNSSLNLFHTAEKIAEIRGTTTEVIAAETKENAKRLFNIS